MNINTKNFAFIVLSVTLGCANAADTDEQKNAQSNNSGAQAAETAQATETAQAAETVQTAETAQSAETAQAADDEAWDPDEVTCKRIKKTGSRLRTKVCATNSEWKQSEEQGQDTTKEFQRRSRVGRERTSN